MIKNNRKNNRKKINGDLIVQVLLTVVVELLKSTDFISK